MKKVKTADRVKMIRELNNLTQSDFANIINLSPKTISMWENGDREITRENIKIIADKFNVPAEFLDYGIDANLTKEQKQQFDNYFNNDEYHKNFNRILENCKTKLTADGIPLNKEYLPSVTLVDNKYIISYGIFDDKKLSNIIHKKIWKQFVSFVKNVEQEKPYIDTNLIDDKNLYDYNYKLIFKYNLLDLINEEVKNSLKLEDMIYCENISILKSVINNTKEKCTPKEFKEQINYLLENLSPNNNNYYEIIIYLIDNGAFYKIPYELNLTIDIGRTNFIYRLSKDMIEIKNRKNN